MPQQSLRTSIQKVFAKTPGLHKSMVMTPFEVGESAEQFDILIVDEAHRLNQRANQASAAQNTKFQHITEALFGFDGVDLISDAHGADLGGHPAPGLAGESDAPYQGSDHAHRPHSGDDPRKGAEPDDVQDGKRLDGQRGAHRDTEDQQDTHDAAVDDQ